jgi:hypothetical protein
MEESSSSSKMTSPKNNAAAVINLLENISNKTGLPFPFVVNLYVNDCKYDAHLFIQNIKDLLDPKEVTFDEVTPAEEYDCIQFVTGLSTVDMWIMGFKLPEDKDMCEFPHNILSVEYAQQAMSEIGEQEFQPLDQVGKKESSEVVEEQVSSSSSTNEQYVHSTKRSRSEEPVRKSARISEKKNHIIDMFSKSTIEPDESVCLSDKYENNFDGGFKYEELVNDKILS